MRQDGLFLMRDRVSELRDRLFMSRRVSSEPSSVVHAAPLPATRARAHAAIPHVSHNDMLVSILDAFGSPDRTFGDPARVTGPLPNPKLAA